MAQATTATAKAILMLHRAALPPACLWPLRTPQPLLRPQPLALARLQRRLCRLLKTMLGLETWMEIFRFNSRCCSRFTGGRGYGFFSV